VWRKSIVPLGELGEVVFAETPFRRPGSMPQTTVTSRKVRTIEDTSSLVEKARIA
jgi:hypothetical protein